jgi:hypothetical protein
VIQLTGRVGPALPWTSIRWCAWGGFQGSGPSSQGGAGRTWPATATPGLFPPLRRRGRGWPSRRAGMRRHSHRIEEPSLRRRHFSVGRGRLGDKQVDDRWELLRPHAPIRSTEHRQVTLGRRVRMKRADPAGAAEELLRCGQFPSMGRQTSKLDVDDKGSTARRREPTLSTA